MSSLASGRVRRVRDVPTGDPGAGEGDPAGDRLRLPGPRPADLRQAQLAQLNPFDLVVLLSLSNTVQNAIIGDDTSVTGGLIGAFSLLTVNYLVVRFLFRHRRLDQLFEGRPTVLIHDGLVIHKALAKELLTVSELRTVRAPAGLRDAPRDRAPRARARRHVLDRGQEAPRGRPPARGAARAARPPEPPDRGAEGAAHPPDLNGRDEDPIGCPSSRRIGRPSQIHGKPDMRSQLKG